MHVVESLFDALKALDLERALGHLSEDVLYHNPPFPPERGKAAVARVLRLVSRFATSFDIRVHNIAERNGVVLTERTDTLRGPFADLGIWVCGTFEVRGGKITLWRDRFDTSALAVQLVTSPVRRALRYLRER